MAKSKSKELSRAKAVLDACDNSQEMRTDGYQNVLTKYGTKQDSSTAFSFVPEEFTDDYTLSVNYQFNGLFAKIIDLPAGEAVSKGFKLNINNEDIEKEIKRKCSLLNLEERLETAIKWSRLHGGAIAVMLIYDGRGLDEPLNYKTIRGIDEIKVYESAVVNPLFSSSYYSGEPEYYQVNALEGTFTVHASRCLLFRNGILPQQVCDTKRRIFGFAEYDRLKTALRETVTSHGYAPRMLERAIQSVIKIKDLASLLGTAKGEDFVVKRLQLIDMARSMFNSMAIDAEGEDFDFKAAPYTGVKEVLDSTCNMLSAVSNIPQPLLFGSSPQGMDSTGESDLENWYNYVGQIQKRMVKAPLETLIGIIIQTLVRTGKIDDYPEWELEFEPLWSMSEAEQAQVDLTRAQIELTKAQTAQTYVGLGSLDPTEIRTGLAKKEEYHVETLLDDVPDDELFASMIDESSDDAPIVPPAMPQGNAEGVTPQSATEVIPQQEDSTDEATAAAVLVVNSEGKILCGVRSDNNLVCGPGGHIEAGEQPIVAAIRESQEEFGITPTSLIPLATLGENNALHHKTDVFFCTSFSGTPKCDEKEMKLASFITLEELLDNRDKMFKPFLDSLEVLAEVKKKTTFLNSDEGNSNSGNHGHEGRPGEIGGSMPSTKQYSGLSDSSREGLRKRLENPQQFGMTASEKEEATKKFVSDLQDDGIEVSFDEDYGVYRHKVTSKLSFQENNDIAKALTGGYSTLSTEEYVRQCEADGVKPDFHQIPEDVSGYVEKTDGTPIYLSVSAETSMTSEELIKYGAGSASITSENREKAKKLSEATEKAIDSISDDELGAIKSYTSQYGVNYQRVNDYLSGKTPEDSEAKKTAELLTSALDHEIGADTVTYRGQGNINHITNDPKIQKICSQIERCNFSSAGKLKEALEGKIITNDTVTSTSKHGAGDYSSRPVQVIFKTPANAKAVDISSVSKYGGGRSSTESKLASAMGASLQIESEVAYKPGMRYKIDTVDFGLNTSGKKNKGQIFITATVLTDNEDGDSKKMIDTVSTSDIMKLPDSQADGGPGSGNFGHEGRPGKRGGSAPEGEGSSSEGKSESKEEKKSESKKSEGSKKPPESRPVASVKKTPAPEFKAKFDEAKATQAPEDAWRVDDTYTVEDYEHANCLTTEGGSCVAVKPDGDIVSVCKNMNSTDRGSDLLKRAIENGGDRLDAFGPGLYSFYTKNGFEPVSWTPFNEEYAPHDWDSSRDAKEPVVFYRYTGKKTEMSFTDFIRNTPKSTDYDEAKNIRDSKAGENK